MDYLAGDLDGRGAGHAATAPAKKPTIVKVIICDWDGTFTSYDTLHAVGHLRKTLADHISPENADKFLSDLVQNHGFQRVLHGRSSTIAFFQKFATDHGLQKKNPEVLKETIAVAKKIQKDAFRVYPGAFKALRAFREADVPVIIYTNSATPDLMKRMHTSGVCPTYFAAIYAKHDPERPPIEAVRPKFEWSFGLNFMERIIPYSEYRKPHPQPVCDIIAATGADPRHAMTIGEGAKDVQVVHRAAQHTGQMGLFAFQHAGARHCNRIQRLNEAMRPGSEPLGDMQVLKALQSERIPPANVIHMTDGFPTLNKKIANGEIKLVPPPRRAKVRDGRLVGIDPCRLS